MGAVAAEPCVELGFGGVDGGGTLVSFPAIEVVGGGRSGLGGGWRDGGGTARVVTWLVGPEGRRWTRFGGRGRPRSEAVATKTINGGRTRDCLDCLPRALGRPFKIVR
jgi:hypothetical protein